jgi:hypothetical protein
MPSGVITNCGLLSFLNRYRYIAIFILIALTVLAGLPATAPHSPTWEVWVVDQSDHPLENMTVDLRCQFAGSYASSEVLQTDERGYVVFKPRTLRVPEILRIAAIVPIPYFNSKFGPQAWVWARGNGLEGVAMNDGHVIAWRGAPPTMASKIVAKQGHAVIGID